MKKNVPLNRRQSDILFSVIVFAFLLVYTYSLLFLVPYPGFYFNPTDGAVMVIYEDLAPASVPHLMVGDVLKTVGSISFEEYSNSATLNFFEGYKPGDIVEIVVDRNGESISIPWVYTGFNRTQFESHFFNIWWLAYVFWLIGTSTQLFMRPKDKHWSLFVAANYLTGMFIMLGAVSSFQFLASSIFLRIVAWLMLPVYLHFHWIFPRSLRPIPRWAQFVFYLLCGGIAIMQLFSATPSPLYFLAVILAFGGSILLLVAHYIFQPEYRREVGILAIAAFSSLGFTIVASIVGSSGYIPPGAVLSLFALPILPAAYFYVLYRRSLGGLELRTNRAISLYSYLVFLGTVLLLAVSYTGLIDISSEVFVFATVMIALLTSFTSLLVFPAFQAFVERRVLGIKLPARNMVENYSARIVTSTRLPALLKLLEEEVFPSLFIRQYAFVRVVDSSAKVLLSEGVTDTQVREEAVMDLLGSSPAEGLSPPPMTEPSLKWVRLAIPLRIGSDLIGGWLLGRRDPDDHYPQAELPILQSLADQTAVALSNLLQADRLKLMYEANIHRYEQERLRLARDLHDSLLNEMAAMLMKHDPASLPPEFQKSFDGLIVRLREIVRDLRPPMLVYGLKYALDDLADHLSERNNDRVHILVDIQAEEDCRYPERVENNLYRIVQEACENALKYAQARSIHILGTLTGDSIELHVVDDGVGLDENIRLRLEDMIANKHYGLAGMHERAELIGAQIQIHSRLDRGTQILVLWEAKDSI